MYDALTIAAIVDELNATLLGGRIQRVLAVDRLTVGFEVYSRDRFQFLASADPRGARLHLVRDGRLTADTEIVTPLLLLLRKHARGARIVEISQVPLERIIHLRFTRPGFREIEAGEEEPAGDDIDERDRREWTLAVEIMGRHSNLILIDDRGTIVESIKRVPPRLSRVRPVLPRGHYVLPPPQEKADPRALTTGALAGLLAIEPAAPLHRVLVAELRGVSPQVAREVAHRATGAADRPASAVLGREQAVVRALGEVLAPLATGAWAPRIYADEDGRPVAFSPMPLYHLGGLEETRVASISAAAEAFFEANQGTVAHQQRKAALRELILGERGRIAAREHSLAAEEARAREADRWRAWGEAIFAWAWAIEPGQRELVTPELRVPLDPQKSASENARHYFEQYRKAQSGAEQLPVLLASTRASLGYLDQLLALLEVATGYDQIDGLDREWRAWRLARGGDGTARPVQGPGKPTRGTRRAAVKRPRALRARGGHLIYVGSTGLQNEMITFEIGAANDTWLHARGVPGAHVLVRWADGTPDEAVLRAAAELAASRSGSAGSSGVEVDYAARRDVRKIKGAGPGMVTYRNERTIRVTPRKVEELLRAGLLLADPPGGA